MRASVPHRSSDRTTQPSPVLRADRHVSKIARWGCCWWSARRGLARPLRTWPRHIWTLQRVGGHPLTQKQILKAGGSTDTLPLPPICVTALRIAKRNQDQAHPVDQRPAYAARNMRSCSPHVPAAQLSRATSIWLSTFGAPGTASAPSRSTTPAAPAAHYSPRSTCTRASRWPSFATARISLTMEIYTQVPDTVTTDALRRLSDWLDHDENQVTRPAHELPLLYAAAVRHRQAVAS
jgi:hypothetical protein